MYLCEKADFDKCVVVPEGEFADEQSLIDEGRHSDMTKSVKITGAPNCNVQLFEEANFGGS